MKTFLKSIMIKRFSALDFTAVIIFVMIVMDNIGNSSYQIYALLGWFLYVSIFIRPPK